MAWLRTGLNRYNNFDFIRLLAALQVVLWHAAGHLKVPFPPWFFHFLGYFPGVPIFFFLSGMLVTYSYSSSRSVASFYLKRVRRVFPALWVAFGIALTLLVTFGQLTTRELKLPAFWLWAATQISFCQFYNPEFFRRFGTGVVNGSLWTISVEIGFYLVLPLIIRLAATLSTGTRNPRRSLEAIVIPTIFLSYIVSYYFSTLGSFNGVEHKAPLWVRLMNQTFLPHFWLFGLGILAYLRYDALKAKVAKATLLLLLFYVVFSVACDCCGILDSPPVLFVNRVLLCVAVLAFGLAPIPIAAKLLNGWDLSYGIYVFHMLLLNTYLAMGGQSPWAGLLFLIGTSCVLAAMSWKFIERPSMRLGRRPAEIVKPQRSQEVVA